MGGPRYWERRLIAPCRQGSIALEQLPAHHLDPGPFLTVGEVNEITGCTPPPMELPVVTVKLLRWLLSKTHPSSLFHDGVTYRMIAAPGDFVLEILCQRINCCFRSGDPMAIPQADFLALRKKIPVLFCVDMSSHFEPFGVLENGNPGWSTLSEIPSRLIRHNPPLPDGCVPWDFVPGCTQSPARHRRTPLEKPEGVMDRFR